MRRVVGLSARVGSPLQLTHTIGIFLLPFYLFIFLHLNNLHVPSSFHLPCTLILVTLSLPASLIYISYYSYLIIVPPLYTVPVTCRTSIQSSPLSSTLFTLLHFISRLLLCIFYSSYYLLPSFTYLLLARSFAASSTPTVPAPAIPGEPKEPKIITSAIPGPKSKALWDSLNELQDPRSTHFFADYEYVMSELVSG